ncbi:PleD family two-component system response regulator [Methylophaga thalassica]|uniref:response regulator n=1 Tax=Methylophaga thalassica TaxID=40223 RepID=UPI003605C7C4
MQVLVVDDNEIDCLTTGSFVEKANMNLLVANDPYSALEIIANQEITPEIIVVDWIMPKMNGLELCQKIRELKFTITPYIIMVTSNSLGENEQNALDVGADDFIEKPIHGAIFISRLRVGARIINLQKSCYHWRILMN